MFQLATTASAVEEAFAAGKVASLIGIEGTVCFVQRTVSLITAS